MNKVRIWVDRAWQVWPFEGLPPSNLMILQGNGKSAKRWKLNPPVWTDFGDVVYTTRYVSEQEVTEDIARILHPEPCYDDMYYEAMVVADHA